jgi:hypothetical protein
MVCRPPRRRRGIDGPCAGRGLAIARSTPPSGARDPETAWPRRRSRGPWTHRLARYLRLGDRINCRIARGQRASLSADSLIARARAAVYVDQLDDAGAFTHQAAVVGDRLTLDLPLLYLLVRLIDRTLDSVTVRVEETVLRAHPRHPPVLYFAGEFEPQCDRPAAAIQITEQIDASPRAYDHWTAILSYLRLGEHYATARPDRARV